jgi:ribonuclease HI
MHITFTAIELALAWLLSSNATQDVVIFTDSLSSVEAIQSGVLIARANKILEIYDLINQLNNRKCLVTFAWIPRQVGIPGNEMADKLCKEATIKPAVNIHLMKELQDAFADIDKFIHKG